MEEQSASSARALDSSLWEVCALRNHWLSTVSRAATVLLHDQWDAAEELVAPDQDQVRVVTQFNIMCRQSQSVYL